MSISSQGRLQQLHHHCLTKGKVKVKVKVKAAVEKKDIDAVSISRKS
jgi:hypothetical protein